MSITKASRLCVVLLHHQYREKVTGPWVTHKVDVFGPSYDIDVARVFAEKAALEAPRSRYTLGTHGSATGITDRIWVVFDGENRRTLVEATRLQPTKGRVRQAWSNIRTWLGDKPVQIDKRRHA